MIEVVIIGAGFAGLRALHKLSKYDDTFHITLIEKNNFSLEKPELPEVAFEGKSIEEVKVDFKFHIKKYNIDIIQGEVKKINPDKNIVIINNHEIAYDYLLIASGAIKDYDAIKGYREYGYSICDDKEAAKLQKRLKSFEGGNIVTGAAKSEFGHLVKAPNLKAPCEGPIGEVMFMMDYKMKKENKKANIKVFTPSKVFFEDVGENARSKIAKFMKEKNIQLFTNKELIEITKDKIIFSDGTSLDCDLAIIIPPYKAPEFIANSNLGDDKGWVPVNEQMQHIEYKNIYAIGDCSALSQPKLGHIAVHQADVAVSSILVNEGIENEVIKFKPEVFCIMNMGGFEATLIYSNVLYNGKYDIAWHSPIARFMKISFDEYYYFTHGHLPPDFTEKALESIIHTFS